MTAPGGLRETHLAGLVPFARGKVRDMYAVGDDRLLIVATDRLSAFDVVLPTPIPDKGKVLNQLSAFWLRRTAGLFPNHFLTDDVAAYPPELQAHRDVLSGRSMLVRRAQRIDVECVARGYLAGSAWSEYRRSGTAGGLPLAAGLAESERLPVPIFTPAIKAATGHDENIPFQRLEALVGPSLAARLREATLAVYQAGAAAAAPRGVIIADTKLEFGLLPDGGLLLIDELLTPDSSRFWEATTYRPGASPPSYDKQYVRDYLESTAWNKEPPAPTLPPEVVAQTRARYVDALRRLTGEELRG